MQLIDDHYCFACGDENKQGLGIQWVIEGKTTRTEFIPGKRFQGWKDVVHGGILATLLDEAMTRLAWVVCGGALTAEMSVRYLAPAKTGEKIFVVGEIVNENRKIVEMKAALYKKDPVASRDKSSLVPIARAKGKAIKIPSR